MAFAFAKRTRLMDLTVYNPPQLSFQDRILVMDKEHD